jgi:hypothetical protein
MGYRPSASRLSDLRPRNSRPPECYKESRRRPHDAAHP